MNKTIINIIIFALIAIAIVVDLRFLSGPEDDWVCADGQWVKHGNPSGRMPNLPCAVKPAVAPTEPKPIGGDTDAGGCLVGAGYSWCEAKQKCLRVWEEKCDTTEQTPVEK